MYAIRSYYVVPEKRDTRDTRRNKSFKNYNEKKGGNNAKNADNSVKNISKHNNGHGALDKNPRSARSPYNFVPLNEKIIPSDVQDVKFDKYENGKNTGYIDIKIENKTPLFIRGNRITSYNVCYTKLLRLPFSYLSNFTS